MYFSEDVKEIGVKWDNYLHTQAQMISWNWRHCCVWVEGSSPVHTGEGSRNFPIGFGIQTVYLVLFVMAWLRGSLLQLHTPGRMFLNLNGYYFEPFISFQSHFIPFCLVLSPVHPRLGYCINQGPTRKQKHTDYLKHRKFNSGNWLHMVEEAEVSTMD